MIFHGGSINIFNAFSFAFRLSPNIAFFSNISTDILKSAFDSACFFAGIRERIVGLC